MLNLNPAFLLVQRLKSAPKGFTLGVKVEIEKKHFDLPQVCTKKCGTLWPCIGPKAEKEYHRIWEANLQPLGSML